MAKTKEELANLKQEYQTLTNKLNELSPEEINQITGGGHCGIYIGGSSMIHAPTFGEKVSNGKINPSSTKGWFGTSNESIDEISSIIFGESPTG